MYHSWAFEKDRLKWNVRRFGDIYQTKNRPHLRQSNNTTDKTHNATRKHDDRSPTAHCADTKDPTRTLRDGDEDVIRPLQAALRVKVFWNYRRVLHFFIFLSFKTQCDELNSTLIRHEGVPGAEKGVL